MDSPWHLWVWDAAASSQSDGSSAQAARYNGPPGPGDENRFKYLTFNDRALRVGPPKFQTHSREPTGLRASRL
jgi:hypothetical protein